MAKMKTYETFKDWYKDRNPKQRRLISRLRKIVDRVAPNLVESSKWSNGVWLKGDLPIIFIHTKSDHIQFGFFAGSSFSDPRGLLCGSAKWVRHIRVESLKDIDESAFATMIRKAVKAKHYKQVKGSKRSSHPGLKLQDHFAVLSPKGRSDIWKAEDFWKMAFNSKHPKNKKILGYLISQFEFDRDWDSWEIHPNGDEIVVCISGSITFVLETSGQEQKTKLAAGEYVVVPKNTWHTAKTNKPCKALFVTWGYGTQHRPI